MAYGKFTNLELKQLFGVEQVYRNALFTNVAPRPASGWLQNSLALGVNFALDQDTEKARSEYIIAPVFLELRQQTGARISIFSGIEFNVDQERKLAGFCDFLVSRSPYQAALEAPVVVAVEAKRQDFRRGLTQCVAEMIAARIYNERLGQMIPTIYGCVTTGDVWRFVRLRDNLAEIELATFDITSDLERILGILWAMAFDEL